MVGTKRQAQCVFKANKCPCFSPGVKKPFFVEPLKDQVVAEGGVVRLQTIFGGQPEAHVQWMRNDNPIQSSAVFKVSIGLYS